MDERDQDPRARSGDETNPGAHLVLVLVQVLFATFPVAGKYALEGFAPLAVATWRVLFGGILLLLLAQRLHPDRWRAGREWPRLFLLSLFGVSLNQMFFIEGLKRSTAVSAGLMMAIIPAATYGFALLGRQERFRRVQGLGLMLAFSGAAIVALQTEVQNGGATDPLIGNLLLLANALSYALYLVMARPVLQQTPPLVVTAWTFALAVPIVPLVTVLMGTPWLSGLEGARPVGALIWILIFPTVVSYSLISWALVRLPASIIAFYVYLQPVLGVLMAVVILGEGAGTMQIVGGLFVMAGIYLVSWRRSRNGGQGRVCPDEIRPVPDLERDPRVG